MRLKFTQRVGAHPNRKRWFTEEDGRQRDWRGIFCRVLILGFLYPVPSHTIFLAVVLSSFIYLVHISLLSLYLSETHFIFFIYSLS